MLGYGESPFLRLFGATSPGDGLLAPWDETFESLDWDLLLRYSFAARSLQRMLGRQTTPVRILEVGCNVVNLLPRFFKPGVVELIRSDVARFDDDPNFVLISKNGPLPFAKESFDAVVALEVLEHMPRERRGDFLSECCRVARHGAVFSCPNGGADSAQAESIVDAAYRQRHRQRHPFLIEHAEFGTPTEGEIASHLAAFDLRHVIFDQAPINSWLAFTLLAESLNESTPGFGLPRSLNRYAIEHALDDPSMPYRKFYVVAKSFDATNALETAPTKSSPATPLCVASALQMMAGAAAAMNSDSMAPIHGLSAVTNQLRSAGLRSAHQQLHAVASALHSITNSPIWRWLEPVRFLRRLIRPRGVEVVNLVADDGIEADPGSPPNGWIVRRREARLYAPCCLPAGWLDIRIVATCDTPGRMRISTIATPQLSEQAILVETTIDGRIAAEYEAYLEKPAFGIQIEPLDRAGKLNLEVFSVRPDRWSFLRRRPPRFHATSVPVDRLPSPPLPAPPLVSSR